MTVFITWTKHTLFNAEHKPTTALVLAAYSNYLHVNLAVLSSVSMLATSVSLLRSHAVNVNVNI